MPDLPGYDTWRLRPPKEDPPCACEYCREPGAAYDTRCSCGHDHPTVCCEFCWVRCADCTRLFHATCPDRPDATDLCGECRWLRDHMLRCPVCDHDEVEPCVGAPVTEAETGYRLERDLAKCQRCGHLGEEGEFMEWSKPKAVVAQPVPGINWTWQTLRPLDESPCCAAPVTEAWERSDGVAVWRVRCSQCGDIVAWCKAPDIMDRRMCSTAVPFKMPATAPPATAPPVTQTEAA